MVFSFLRRRAKARREVRRANQLCQHRGIVIGHWAGVESAINQANHYGWQYSREVVGNVVPQSLRWKRQTFEKLHVKSIPFMPLRAKAKAILDEIDRLEVPRHFLVHGYWEVEQEPGWLLKKTQFNRDGSISLVSWQFSENDMLRLEADLLALGDKIVGYAYALLDHMHQYPLAMAAANSRIVLPPSRSSSAIICSTMSTMGGASDILSLR
jgi:hypothetical protein